MQRSPHPSLEGSQHDDHAPLSGEGGVDVSASSASGGLETLVVSTTIASSSLSTFSQITTAETAELDAGEDEVAASHFALAHPAISGSSGSPQQPYLTSQEAPSSSQTQAPSPRAVPDSPVAVHGASQQAAAESLPVLALKKALLVIDKAASPVGQPGELVAHAPQHVPMGLTVQPSADVEDVDVPAAPPSVGERSAKEPRRVPQSESQVDASPGAVSAPTVSEGAARAVISLKAAAEMMPLQLSPSENGPSPPPVPTSASQAGEASIPPPQLGAAGRSPRDDGHSASLHGEGNNNTPRSNNGTSTAAYLSPRGRTTSLDTTEEEYDDDTAASSRRARSGRHGTDAAYPSAERMGAGGGEGCEEKGRLWSVGWDADGNVGAAEIMQLATQGDAEYERAPPPPRGIPRRRHRAPYRPSNSRLRAPATARLAAGDSRHGAGTSGADDVGSSAGVSPSSPPSLADHRSHLQLPTAAPPLVAVDAPITTHTLEVASTRSSLSLSSPSEVAMPMIRSDGRENAVVNAPGGGGADRERKPFVRVSPLPTRSKMADRHGSWPAELFSGSENGNAEEEGGTPAPQPQLAAPVSPQAEEEIVGETTVFPVAHRAPASTVAPETSIEEVAPVPRRLSEDAARPSTRAPTAAHPTSSPSPPATLVLLSATEEEAAVKVPEGRNASPHRHGSPLPKCPTGHPVQPAAVQQSTLAPASLTPKMPIIVSAKPSFFKSAKRSRATVPPVLSAVEEEHLTGLSAAPQTPLSATNAAEASSSAPTTPQRVTVEDLLLSSPPAVLHALPSSRSPIRARPMVRNTTVAALPPRFSITGSVDTSSTAATSWSQENAALTGPHLSLSGLPVGPVGGAGLPLIMARFANRGPVSVGDSCREHADSGGQRGGHDASSSSRSYSYSYSYTGSYSYESSVDHSSSPRTPTPTPVNVQSSISFSSTEHERDLSDTRVGLTGGLRDAGRSGNGSTTHLGGGAAGGDSSFIELTAYEVVAAAAKKAKDASKINFLRCLCKRPAREQRTWHTEERVVPGAASRLSPAQAAAGGEGTVDTIAVEITTVPTTAQEDDERRVAHTGSAVDLTNVTASAATESNENEDAVGTSLESGSVKEAARAAGSRRDATEEGEGAEGAVTALNEGSEAVRSADLATQEARERADENFEALGSSADISNAAAEAERGTGSEAASATSQLRDSKGKIADAVEVATPLEQPPKPETAAADAVEVAKPEAAAHDTAKEVSASNVDPDDNKGGPSLSMDHHQGEQQQEAPGQTQDGEEGAAEPRAHTPGPSEWKESSDADGLLRDAAASVNVSDGGAGPLREDSSNAPPNLVAPAATAELLDAREDGEVDRPVLAGTAHDAVDSDDAPQHSFAEGASSPSQPTAAEVPPLEPLKAFYVYIEEAPRLLAWDAEPPSACAEAAKEDHDGDEERWEDRLQKEAAATAAAAQAALRHALSDMAVHPPRQCLLVEIHGLHQLSRAVLCPRYAMAGTANPTGTLDYMPTAETAAGVWRGSGCSTRVNREALPLNDTQASLEEVEEEPEWVVMRLAVYSNDRLHLVAAGSTFKLPANGAAMRRCEGLFDASNAQCVAGLGRDSWSDVLIYQVAERHEDDRDGDSSADNAGNISKGIATALPTGPASEGWSAFNTAALYVQLEERRERWVPVEEAGAQPGCAPLQGSGAQPTRRATPLRRGEGDGEVDRVPRIESGASGSVELKTDSKSDAESLLISTNPSTCQHTSCPQYEHPSERAIVEEGERMDMNAAGNEVQGGAERRQRPLRLDEYWSFLAISQPLPMTELQRFTAEGLPVSVHMTVPASALYVQGTPRNEEILSCRVRWVVEPPPSLTCSSLHEGQRNNSNDSAWASLSAAIAQYDRVCREHGDATLLDSCNHKANEGLSDHPRLSPAPPLTVLWETICTPAAALRCYASERGIRDSTAPQRRWGNGLMNAHALSTALPAGPRLPSVCSVVVRCSAAVLLPRQSTLSCAASCGSPLGLSSTYCAPTVLSVTGGLDGFVGRTTAPAATAMGRATLDSRTPMLRYNLDFHALLTREEAPSLLFTVQSAVTPLQVFGFAEFNPFECSEEEQRALGSSAGGVMDRWLPLFAPLEAAVTAAESQERRRRASMSPSLAGDGSEAVAEALTKSGCPVVAGGMSLSGWLHCDVEIVFLGSLSEAAAQRLWNGTQHSLTALDTAAASEVLTGGNGGSTGREMMMDSVVDICVVEAVGLRPLATRLGAPLPPAPLRWDVTSFDVDIAEAQLCTNVYCEVVTLQLDAVQQDYRCRGSSGHMKRNDDAADAAASSVGGHSTQINPVGVGSADEFHAPQQRSAVDVCSLSRGSPGRWSASVKVGGRHEGRAAGTTHTVLPVTTAVAHTNHPRWQHNFRCGLATLNSLYLRVFDRVGTDKKRGGEANAGSGAGHARSPSASLSLLLGTATLSPWMLRCLVASANDGPSRCEGSVWLPLLWTPTTSASPSGGRGRGVVKEGGGLQAYSHAVSNGYVLVQWRRALRYPSPSRFTVADCCVPSPRSNDATFQEGACISVTRRCPPQKALRWSKSAHRLRTCSIDLNTRLLALCGRAAMRFPSEWYDGVPSPQRTRRLTWMSPELAPWLWVHRLRLQWPWLQHTLAMSGGHVRLKVFYLCSSGEQRPLDQFLLVPVSPIVRGGDHYRECRTTPRRVGARPPRRRSAGADEDGEFCAVPTTCLSLNAFHCIPASAPPPLETTFCFPASPYLAFQLWWYPQNAPFVAMGDATSCPPRLLGRGRWRFPSTEVDSYNDGEDSFGSLEKDDGQSEVDDVTSASSLHRFFTLHDADVRLFAEPSVDAPRLVEGGVLRLQLSSVPRLACDVSREAQEERTQNVASTLVSTPPLTSREQASRAAGAFSTGDAQRWRWPDVGTAATLHVQVHNVFWFHHADEAAVAVAAGKMRVAVQEVLRSSTSSPRASACTFPKEESWVLPEDVLNAEVPRVPYAAPGIVTDGGGADCNSDGAWLDVSSRAQCSQSPSVKRASFHASSISIRDARPSRAIKKDEADPNKSVSSPVVELLWAPRRFEWLNGDLPTVALWLLSEEANSDEGGEIAPGERVWGAIRLPRLEAFTANAGVLWLPLFRTYAAASSLGPSGARVAPDGPSEDAAEPELQKENKGDGTLDNSRCGSGTRSTQSAPGNEETSHTPAEGIKLCDVAVEHVGYAAVSYVHNFVEVNISERPDRDLLPKRCADDAVLAVNVTTSRLLLVHAGPLRCRYAEGSAIEPGDGRTRDTATFMYNMEQSNRSSPEGSGPTKVPPPVTGELAGDAASASHSRDDFTVSPSMPTASLLQAPLCIPPFLHPPAGSSPTEVLLGFESYQLIVPVTKAETSQDSTTLLYEQTLQQVAVFPWLNSRSGGEDVRTVRVQTQLRGPGGEGVMAASNMFSVRSSEDKSKNTLASGAQWLPLISRIRSLPSNSANAAVEGSEDGCVVGEVLVRWNLIEPPSSMLEGGVRSPSVEDVQLRWLAERYCGGPGAPCSYAVLGSPFTTEAAAARYPSLASGGGSAGAMNTVTGGEDGSLVDGARSVGEAVGKAREGTSSVHFDSLQSLATSHASLFHSLLSRCGPVHHSCVYLLLECIKLRCAGAHARAWQGLATHAGSSSNGGEHRFRLEVRVEWPADWPASWLCTIPSLASRHESKGETNPANLASTEANALSHPHAGAFTIWMDVSEGSLVEDSTFSASADDYGAERTLKCMCMPLCLPMPSPKHVQLALGLPGLTVRFRVSFRLFALNPSAPADVPQEDSAAGAREKKRDRLAVCLGAGATLLSMPLAPRHKMTSLLPPKASNATNHEPPAMAVPLTKPLFLFWRARLSESMPLQQTPFLSAGAKTAGSAILEGMERSQASLSMPGSALATQEVKGDSTLLHHRIVRTETGGNDRCRGYAMLAHLTVSRIEMLGVDMGLACGTAQRHRQTLAPAAVALLVGGGEEEREENTAKAATALSSGDTNNVKAADSPASAGGDAGFSVPLATSILLTPSLSANAGCSRVSSTSPLLSSVAPNRLHASCRVPKQRQQRYKWATDVCLRSRTQLALYVCAAEANLRAARGEEMWSTAELRHPTGAAGVPDGCSVDRVSCKLIGKAVYMLDSESWTQIQRSAESGQVDTREVLLDLVSPIEGRWMGRLWLEVSFLAADTFPRDPRGIFLSTCVSLQVSSCKGLVVGDVALARRMESSYQMLRRRVREEYERRGRVPHKLRQHVKEVRHLRRHLDKQGRCSVMVRLVCVSEGSTNGDPSTWASQPFQLPSALSVVRGEVLAQEPLERSWGAGGQAAKDTISTSASGPLLTLSQIVNDQTNNDSRAAVTRFELRSVSLRDTSGAHDDDDDADCNEGVVAVGHARLPLRVGNSLPRAAPYAQNLTVPLTLRTGGEVDQAENAAAGKKTRGLIHPHLMVANASSDTPGALTMTATWSLIPARGDTYVTCLLLEVSSGRCSVERGYCHWILRWVYVFESSDHPEVEHAVDVPLSLQPSSPQPATQRAPSPADVAGVFTYKSAGLNSLAFWSGATTRLPRVGSMGATLRRVELLEATPVASTVLSEEPQAGGGVYTMVRLAMHTWTDEDELQLRARQQQSQHLGGDVCMWLSFTSTATGGRQVCHYRFLLGLYSSNAVAQYEMQRLERRMALAGAKSVTSIDGATHESRFQSQDASQMGLLRFSRSPLLRTQAGVGASDSTHSAAAACRMGDASVGMDEERSTEARRGGGVVMRTVLFRCADSALTTAGLTAVVSATCRIVRDAEGGGVLGGSTGAPGGDWHPDNERIVLDAGPATRVLQTHSSPSLNDATDTSTPQAAVAHVTATWTRTDYSRRMKIRRCAKAGVSQASHLFQQPIQGLLRLDIPTRATAEGSAFHQPSSMAGVASDGDNSASGVPEVQLCVEVCVGDGDSAVRYVSDYFSARSVLCAAGRVKLDRNAPLDESECASWTMQLNMHRAATPSAMAVGGPTSAAAQSRVECGAAVAEVEMLWGLDLVGVQSALAAVPCLSRPSASCRNGETAESRRREAANAASCDREDESTSEGGDHATLQQVEGYSAWSDFFATLRAQEQLRNQQAHLRHWRLRIVGIEVEGLELPVWAAGGVGRGGQRPSLTTILAQLNFSTKPLSGEVKPEEVKGQAKTASNVPEDSVLGVTRAVAVSDGLLTRCDSMQPNADHGDAANAPLLQRQRVLTGEVEPNRSLSSRRARAYRVSFAPSAWCIALHDIMRHRRVAAHRADEGTGFEDGARSAAASPPPPELTLWQLLTPTAAAAFAAATHEVYELGAVQLSSLFHECALFLVQVLARWCSGACTLEERDTVLRATASFPSHWMPLDAAASPAGAGSALMGRRDGVPRVRFFYSFLYDGPQCPAATAFPGMQPTTSPGVVSVVPPTVPVPTTLADAVYCAQLDHAQLEYQKLSSAAEGHTSLGTSSNEGDQLEDAAINWLSHVVLEMRVVLTTVNAADEGSVIDSHVVARWATRLAPLPSLPRPKPKSKVPPAPVMPPMQATVASPLRPVPVPVPIPVAKPEGSAQPPSAATRAAAPELAVAALALREPAVSETTEKKQQLPSPGGSSAQPQPTKSAAPMSTAAVPAIPTKGCFCWQPSPIERSKRRSSSAGGRQGSAVNTAVLISIEMELRLLPADSAAMATLSPNLACARGEREGHEEGEVVGRSHVFLGRTQASALRWDRAEERLDEGWRLIAPLPVRIPVKASFMLSSTYLHTQVSSRSCGVAVTDAFGAVAPSAPTAHVSFDLLAFTAPSWSLASALEAAQQASNQRQLRALATLKRAEARLLAAVASSTSPPASPSSLGPRAMPSMSSYAISSPSLQRQERLSAAFAAHPCRILRVPPAVYRLDTFTVLDVIKQIERQNRVAESDKLQDGQSPWFALLNMPESDDGRTSAADSREGVVCRKACLVSALTGEVRMLTWRLLPSLTDTAPREVFCGSDAHQQSPLSWLRMPAGRLLIQERARLRFEWCRSADPCPVSSLVGIVGGASISYTSTNGNAWLWVSGGLRLSSIPLRETALNAHAQQLKDLQMCAARSEAGLAVPSPPHCIFTANTWKPSPHRRRSQVPSLSAFADAEVPTRVPTLTAPYYQLYASHCLCQQSTTSVSIDAGSCMPARRPQWKCDVDVATPASLSTPSRNASFRLFHTATKLSDNRVWLLGGWCVANNSAVLPATEGLYECPPTTVTPVNAGLVERRRSEVRHAASTLETAALRWCETVGCMRCMVDGTPAPPVEVILEAANADSGDAATASGCTQAQRQPRVACHVAAACGPRHVVLFGGLVPDVNGPLRAASATADLHTYDTVQGAWARLSAPQGAQLWPMARYGHSCAVVPGTGGTQPSSCFVFGGATTIRQASESVAKGMCELVPPEELLWIWTPFVDIGGRAQCTWRRVQVPADMPSPLTGRFLPQLLALSAAEVLGADAQASPEAEAMDMQGPADRSVPVAAPDVGLTSLVLCVAGGMSKRPMMARASKLPSGVSSGGEMPASKTKVEGDALDAFRQCVEPWLQCPASGVTAVLLTSMCERLAL